MLAPRLSKDESGYALIAALLILMTLGLGLAVKFAESSRRDPDQAALTDYRKASLETLEEARFRLLAKYLAPGNPNPGVFGCPDHANTGQAAPCTAANAKTAGLFPFKEVPPVPDLGLPDAPIVERDGECIWYALSPSFRNKVTIGSRKPTSPDLLLINPDNLGSLKYNGKDVVAVLIAPGTPLSNQTRCSDPARNDCVQGCPPLLAYSASQYLEALSGANNAGTLGAFADAATPSAIEQSTNNCTLKSAITRPEDRGALCNNDVILPIRSSDIMKLLIRRVLEKFATNVDGVDAIAGLKTRLLNTVPSINSPTMLDAVRALDEHGFDTDIFVNMQSLSTPPANNGCFDTTGSDTRPLWLCSHQWYRFIEYNPAQQSLSITLDKSIPTAKYTCTLSLISRGITCQ